MLIAALLIPALAGAGLLAYTLTKAPRLRVMNLLADAPASKRHARAGKVDAVVLHQTGFSRGLDPKRYLKVTAHFVVLANGTVVQLHPLTARLNASNGFNGRSVSVEFVGNFPSVDGKWWEPGKYGTDRVTAEQLEAGRELLRALAAAGVRHVFAHRQASASRGNDPGPDLWAGVGQWALEQLGFSDGGPSYAIDTGRPIPDAWRTHAINPTNTARA
ncbi:peptidoglycan recognition family protein [Nannocystaceae bacterium ST9]